MLSISTVLQASLLLGIAAANPSQFPLEDWYYQEFPPQAKTLNGTYAGVYLPAYHQDAFLGIPFAQPPVGDLRFRRPQPLDTSWEGVREAKTYGKTCFQTSDRTDMSEDCLTLNVVRPSNIDVSKARLPVFVSIYGGGFYAGSSSDPGYNLSGIVEASQKSGQPMIAVSMNYRLGLWGFLSSPGIFEEKNANAGLVDQLAALRWVQENIASFGGDETRVTIWGVSAGGQSIAFQLLSFGARDQGLFHGAILESGGPAGPALQELPFYAQPFEDMAKSLGCGYSKDKLACLRQVPSAELFAKRGNTLWNPIVDGDYLADYPSTMISKSQFIKVPLITGCNSDEGTSFSGPRSISSDDDIARWLTNWRDYKLKPSSIQRILSLYDTYDYPPYLVDTRVQFSNTGAKWRKSGAIGGDIVMMAQRRKVAQAYSKAGVNVWSYRFDTPMWNAAPAEGSKHGIEVAFSFQNITGNMGPLPEFQHYRDLSSSIGTAYVNFVNRKDPNPVERLAQPLLPNWPAYLEKPSNMVLNANRTYVEHDTWREEGISYINSIAPEILW